MAKPTERAMKRKPHAVILLETLTSDVPEVPEDGRDFEWFNSLEATSEFFDQVTEFHTKDAEEHGDLSYMTIEVTDTATMTLGRVEVAPDNEETKKWVESVKDDVTQVFVEIKPKKTSKPDVKVRPKKRNAAAKAVAKNESAPIKQEDKQARLKKRLEEKKAMGLAIPKVEPATV